jgi:hypothetical protein
MNQRTLSGVDETVLAARKPKISLFHRVLLTFHDACDMRDIEMAIRLLKILESMFVVEGDVVPHDRTRRLRGFVAACERLWNLRNSDIRTPHGQIR